MCYSGKQKYYVTECIVPVVLNLWADSIRRLSAEVRKMADITLKVKHVNRNDNELEEYHTISLGLKFEIWVKDGIANRSRTTTRWQKNLKCR